MYERMLDKGAAPTVGQMTAYCGDMAELFEALNEWLAKAQGTAQKVVFPYGNSYGWGIAHKVKQKLICNVFAEAGAFTVMMRLSNEQLEAARGLVDEYTKNCIDNKYPCGGGGWIHYRVTCARNLEDAKLLLGIKCAKD